MFDIGSLHLLLTLLATAVLAASAVIQAVRFEFDVFGALFLGLVTAVGGGTMRDILIGATPAFWLRDLTFIATALPAGAITFLLARQMETGFGRREKLLLYLDAIGLALFTLTGIEVALTHDIHPILAILLGCITGVGGGMIRDILCGLTPIVLKSDIYANLSLAGGTLFILTEPYLAKEIRLVVVFLLIAATRMIIVARRP